MSKSNLVYRKIPSLNFLYEISEDGKHLRNIKSKHQRKWFLNNCGYWRTAIKIKGKQKTVYPHQLVAECWLGEKPKGFEIDHIDGNKSNNHYSNLRYVSHGENTRKRTISKPIMLEKDYEPYYFGTISEAARFIATVTGKNSGTIRNKIKKGRRFVDGFKVRRIPYDEFYSERLDTLTPRGKE